MLDTGHLPRMWKALCVLAFEIPIVVPGSHPTKDT